MARFLSLSRWRTRLPTTSSAGRFSSRSFSSGSHRGAGFWRRRGRRAWVTTHYSPRTLKFRSGPLRTPARRKSSLASATISPPPAWHREVTRESFGCASSGKIRAGTAPAGKSRRIRKSGGEGSRTPVLEMFSASFYRFSLVFALAPATRTGTIRKTEHACGSVSLPAARTPAGSQPAVVAPRLSRRQTGNVTVN